MSREKAPDRRRRGVFTRRRGEVLVDLAEYPNATSAEVATRLGVHQNTIREHLTLLVDESFVVAEVERIGRRGRPRVVYRLGEPTAPVLTGPRLRSAIELARAEAWLLEREDAADDERAVVVSHLERHGFEPVDGTRAGEVVVRCPLAAEWLRLGPALCAAHVTVLDRVLAQAPHPPEQQAAQVVGYHPHEVAGICRVRIGRRHDTGLGASHPVTGSAAS